MIRALVIDDDDNVGGAVRAILATERIEVVRTLRAHAGIRQFEVSEFDLVIVDIFMPGMGGLDAIEEIRRQSPTIPIVAMTGFRFRESANPECDFLAMAARRGANACLSKPFTPQQLIDAINVARSQPANAATAWSAL
jgi:CheY-like chemotaxis protein